MSDLLSQGLDGGDAAAAGGFSFFRIWFWRQMKRIGSRVEIVKDGNWILYDVNILGKSVYAACTGILDFIPVQGRCTREYSRTLTLRNFDRHFLR